MTQDKQSDPTEIFMWRRVNGSLTTSGQPSETQLQDIRDLGVTHIVNLGLHDHEKALPDEEGAVSALGMTYIHIPVDFENPTNADFERFTLVMRELEGKVAHIHCIANLRVSAFLYRYQRDEMSIADANARELMESIWRPGGSWARFVDDAAAYDLPHRFAGRDY